MVKKYQYGRSLPDLLFDGMILTWIISEIKELRGPIDQSLLLHNLYERFPSTDEKTSNDQITGNLKTLKAVLTPQIAKINEHISAANKMVKGLDFNHKIPKLKTSDILILVDTRLKTMLHIDDVQKMSNDFFHTQLSNVFQKPIDAVKSFIKITEDEQYTNEVQKLSEPYHVGITQAMHISSIGYYSTGVFIAGKTMEELINAYFATLFKLHKIPRFDLSKSLFDKKINQLHGLGYLNDDLFHKISSVRIDRNKFGHPGQKELSKHQSHLKIRTIIELIPEVEKRIKKIH